jgi:D-beta-D-heptose 7-phosphate kinase/D-beta-D-heptose 1-phosphate adenosyltransferase
MSGQLISLLEQPIRPRILLLGDLMLDRYLWGDVERISPEAPIPVLRVGKQEHRLGGAGSVASMLAALGCEPILAAVTGDDAEGHIACELLREIGVDSRCVLTDPDRATTLKERLLGRSQQRFPQHMMRVDREDDEAISAELAQELIAFVREHLDRVDLVVISDYNKGVCAGDLIPRVVELARSAGVLVLADPVRGADYSRYDGCACITPNRVEAGLAAGMKIATPQDGLEAARRLLRFGVASAVVTLDRDGIAWADRQGNARLFPGRPRQVADITGAGDMVLSVLAYALSAGADYPTAIELANLAGGLEVERLGVVPISRRELLEEISPKGASRWCPVTPAAEKILPLDELRALLGHRRQAGERIVMTNGCFDLLHPGHVASLQEARKQGDLLVVGLNSDRSVRAIKGEGRPIIDQQGRAEMLAALACVDYVVIFDETSVAGLVGRLLPDVLVKAAQYSVRQVVGHEIVLAQGGQVVAVPMKPAYSTTELIDKIRNLPDGKRSAA